MNQDFTVQKKQHLFCLKKKFVQRKFVQFVQAENSPTPAAPPPPPPPGEKLARRLGYLPLKNWTYFEEHRESQKHSNKQFTT